MPLSGLLGPLFELCISVSHTWIYIHTLPDSDFALCSESIHWEMVRLNKRVTTGIVSSTSMFTCSEQEQRDRQRTAAYFCDRVTFLHVGGSQINKNRCECTLRHEPTCTHLSTMTVTDRTLQRAAAIALNISWTSRPFFILFWHVQHSSSEKKFHFCHSPPRK